MSNRPSDGLYGEIATRIGSMVFPRLVDAGTPVLVAGSRLADPRSLRCLLSAALCATGRITVIDAELVLDELLYDKRLDLLSLESVLASGVRSIVLCVESAGSIAELGAFAGHAALRHRVIVVGLERYRRSPGFIRQGPIRLLARAGQPVLWYSTGDEVKTLVTKVIKAVRAMPTQDLTVANPLTADSFVLPFMFVAGPTSLDALTDAMALVQSGKPEVADVRLSCRVAVSMLFKRRHVVRVGSDDHREDYGLSDSGRAHLLAAVRRRGMSLRHELDRMRVLVLNWKKGRV